MIEFNLLPDIKLEYLKTEKTKRLVFSISLIVAASLLLVLVLLSSALVLQNRQVSNNNKAIKNYSQQLTGTADINKVLTIQNQLKTIVNLYNQTPEATRLYNYLPQLVPQSASVSHLTVDFSTATIKISGAAPKLEVINTFADTLKFATYSVDQQSATKKAFPSVVLQSFTRDPSSASYNFSISFDPALFDRSHTVRLVVPSNYISTRSFTELPSSSLFNSPSPEGGSQ